MRTVREMKRDFKRVNTASTAIENVMVVPFLICSFLPIVTFNLSWLWGALLFAIIQSILHKSNKDKFRNYLIEHEDELYDEDIERLHLPKVPKPKLSKEEQGCWKCSCGEYNQKYETSCHSCGKPKKEMNLLPKPGDANAVHLMIRVKKFVTDAENPRSSPLFGDVNVQL